MLYGADRLKTSVLCMLYGFTAAGNSFASLDFSISYNGLFFMVDCILYLRGYGFRRHEVCCFEKTHDVAGKTAELFIFVFGCTTAVRHFCFRGLAGKRIQ